MKWVCAPILLIAVSIANTFADAPERVTLFADFRTRLEQDFDSQDGAGVEREDRLRLRVRARLGVDVRASERVTFRVRLRSGSDDSHQSPHVTLVDFDGNDTGDADFNLDVWRLAATRGASYVKVGREGLGFRQPHEMLFDADVTPAGVSAGHGWAGTFGTLELRAAYAALPVGMRDFSGTLGGLQAIYTRDAWTLAAGVYDLDAEPGDPDATRLLNGNGLRDYRIVQLSAGLKRDVAGRPLRVELDLLHNAESYRADEPDPFAAANRDETDGVVASVRWGSTGARGAWLVGYTAARIETLAVNASYAQDDWVRWGSAVESRGSGFRGHELRVGRGLTERANMLLRLYVVEALDGPEDGSRLRVDLNYRF